MNGKTRIGIAGVAGRMGQTLLATVLADNRFELSGASEVPGHPWIGQELSEALPAVHSKARIADSPAAAFSGVDAILDFTLPQSTLAISEFVSRKGLVHVIGTTGFTSDQLADIAEAARTCVIVRAGNMCLGVNLLARMTELVARALDDDFDVEVVETHHKHKIDAPSGTALMLGQAAAAGREVSLADASVRGRDGQTGPRQRGAIGFAAIRGGDVVGEHEVIFAGMGERITLRHVATDRSVYAHGALKAVLWGLEQSPGEYDMVKVLGL